jgi:uncharacterized protein (TIGR02246 family)
MGKPAMQKTLWGMVLAVAGLACIGSGTGLADEDDREQIRAALEDWMGAFNRRDVERVCDLFAPDLIADIQGAPRRTYDSLCAGLRRSLNDPGRSLRYGLDLEEILVSGDLAVARLVWTLTIDPQDGSAPTVDRERGLDVYRRQPDGTWKIARFIVYSMPPPADD